VDLLLQAFILGNGAILTNVCLLPLYPGLLAFLAAQRAGELGDDATDAATRAAALRRRRIAGSLGLFVLAGVLTLMLALGALLAVTRTAVAALLPWLLPATFLLVGALGVALLLGRNPFARLATGRALGLRDPRAAAYGYGLMLAPMTLPCTGPVVVAAFVLGAGDPRAFGAEMAYVMAFGLGFGWPLAALPWLAQARQQRVTGWLARRHALLERLSGALLVGIAAWGLLTEVGPNLRA
jgi:cytochrome c-type biogenesis protein